MTKFAVLTLMALTLTGLNSRADIGFSCDEKVAEALKNPDSDEGVVATVRLTDRMLFLTELAAGFAREAGRIAKSGEDRAIIDAKLSGLQQGFTVVDAQMTALKPCLEAATGGSERIPRP